MRILAFDTATALTAVSLRDIPAGIDLARVDDPPAGSRPGHASHLLSLINELLTEAGTGWSEVDRIAVGLGPGTFTGLRIGIATAQALAASAGKPLVGVSTLRSLALAAHEHEHEHARANATLAVIDARRNEVFVAGWAADQSPLDSDPMIPPSVTRPDHLQELLASGGEFASSPTATATATPTIAVGDGALKFAEELASAGAILPAADSPLHRVSARHHCRIAAMLPTPTQNTVEPEYLRIPDAELSRLSR